MNKINGLPPFKRLCVTIGNLPSSYVDSMSYYECVMWLCKYLQEKVVPAINENAEAVNELINWFNNLDVQEEINNKLDEMAESGQLEEIISEYLNSQAIFGYDTVSDMVSAENLIDGSYAKTLGYNSKNDGGSATYKIRTITNEDDVDGATIIAMNNETLVAELIIDNFVTPEQFGCYGDDEHDDTEKFQNMLDKALNICLNPNKQYKITSTLTFRINTKIVGAGESSQIVSYINNDSAIFYNADSISHFIFQDFLIDAKNNSSHGFIITNPYDNCIIKNIYFDNFKKSCLKLGNSSSISQTLLIDNCMVYMSDVALDSPIFELEKCFESNILNNKLLNRQANSSPCLLLTNVYDNNIQGNSFTYSSDCGIKITGSDSRHNRIISNTYELLSGEYSIKLDGTVSNAIQYTMILEPFTYYSAPDKIYCNNECNGYFVGMQSTGGRRNLIFNVNDPNVQSAYGNTNVTSDAGLLTASGFGIDNYAGIQQYQVKSNSAESADYGLEIIDRMNSNKKVVLHIKNNWLGIDSAGGRIKLKSPDGSVTKYIGIANDGTVTTYDSPYYN